MNRSSASIVLVGLYCFTLALFFMFFVINGFVKYNFVGSLADFKVGLTIIGPLIPTIIFIALGMGILRLNQWCWKALFFILAICISTFSSLIVVALILLVLSISITYSFFETFHVTSVMWLSFLFLFLSQIIILYYLTRQKVMSCFGPMNVLADPF